ncbi:hypothetical protein PM082_014357 [Marasmius tenuissimus]|nr:hypothetical protein PM082_014357 [Marasmius tenuissimus]
MRAIWEGDATEGGNADGNEPALPLIDCNENLQREDGFEYFDVIGRVIPKVNDSLAHGTTNSANELQTEIVERHGGGESRDLRRTKAKTRSGSCGVNGDKRTAPFQRLDDMPYSNTQTLGEPELRTRNITDVSILLFTAFSLFLSLALLFATSII